MTFEGHTDRAPRLLPDRERGEAPLAIQEAVPESPLGASSALFAIPAGEVQGGGSGRSHCHHPSRLPSAENTTPPASTDDPQDAA